METISMVPSPAIFPTGRRALILDGSFITRFARPAHRTMSNDGLTIVLGLSVRSRYLPSTPATTDQSQGYIPIEFPLTQLHELRRLMSSAVSRYGQPVISEDDHDVIASLTNLVTGFVNRLTHASENDRVLDEIWVDLEVLVVASTEPASAVFRKVAYRINKKEEEEEVEEDKITETSCPICLQDFGDGEEVHLTPCRHPFHLRCLESWLQCKAQCPLCRSAVPYRR